MVWFLIGLVVVVIVLTLIFTSSIEEIWLLVCAGFVVVGMFLLSIGVPIYSEKAQTAKESTEVYEVCKYSDNEYFQANTAGNSITIRVKTNNGVKEKTFNRKIVTFVDANSSTATVNYKKKEKFTSGKKFWFGLEDGKDAGKKKATKVILSVPLDSEQKVEDSTEQSDTDVKDQKESRTVECQECGSQNDANAKYCISCGAKITQERKCANCGQALEENAKYCQKCGKKWNNGGNVLWRKK